MWWVRLWVCEHIQIFFNVLRRQIYIFKYSYVREFAQRNREHINHAYKHKPTFKSSLSYTLAATFHILQTQFQNIIPEIKVRFSYCWKENICG